MKLTTDTYPHESKHFSIQDFGYTCSHEKSEYTKRPSVYALIYDEDHNIATIEFRKETGRIFCLPGGGVDVGESFERALERETKEEVGCNIANLELLGSFESFDCKGKRLFENVIYKAIVIGKKISPESTDEYEQGSKIVWKGLRAVVQQLKDVGGSISSPLDFRSLMVLKILNSE